MKGGKTMQKILMVITVCAVVALAVLNLTYHFGPEPDVICEMANRNIEWHYAGK
jgi:hypothetical protein